MQDCFIELLERILKSLSLVLNVSNFEDFQILEGEKVMILNRNNFRLTRNKNKALHFLF